ncbi:MAG TPA: hypothetical protein VH637_08680 [Streptosporangiaceae bacterium]|jgi:hypothetical protein
MTPILRLTSAAACAAVAAAVLAACSGPAAPSSAGPAATSSPIAQLGKGVTFHATIQVTGAVRSSARFGYPVPNARTCAGAVARGDTPGGGFVVPTPPGGRFPRIDITIAGYHGAGTYPPPGLRRDKSDSIQLKAGQPETRYVLTAHPARGRAAGKEVLFLYKNGSGQLAFSLAHRQGRKSAPAISGLISWNCTD